MIWPLRWLRGLLVQCGVLDAEALRVYVEADAEDEDGHLRGR
jgi:hypothetical protein